MSCSLLLFYVRSALPAARALRVLAGLRARGLPADVTSSGHIHVFVPLHREQAIAVELHRCIEQLVADCPPNVTFHLLTSDREARGEPGIPSTHQELARRSWSAKVRIWNFELLAGGKGALLNRALEAVSMMPEDWVGLYDADSRPEVGAFSYVNATPIDVGVAQQPSLYVLNYHELGPFLKAQALFQTIWSLGMEWEKAEISRRLLRSGKSTWRLPYWYPVAHGLFLRRRVLDSLGGFPLIYEDLRIGIPLSVMREAVATVPYVDRCQFATSVSQWVAQSQNWMNGSWFVLPDLRDGRRTVAGGPALFLTSKALFSNLAWACEGFFIPGALLTAGLFGSGGLRTLSWALLLMLAAAEVRMLKQVAKGIGLALPLSPLAVLGSVFRLPLRSLGPMLGTLSILARPGVDRSRATSSTEKRGTKP